MWCVCYCTWHKQGVGPRGHPPLPLVGERVGTSSLDYTRFHPAALPVTLWPHTPLLSQLGERVSRSLEPLPFIRGEAQRTVSDMLTLMTELEADPGPDSKFKPHSGAWGPLLLCPLPFPAFSSLLRCWCKTRPLFIHLRIRDGPPNPCVTAPFPSCFPGALPTFLLWGAVFQMPAAAPSQLGSAFLA